LSPTRSSKPATAKPATARAKASKARKQPAAKSKATASSKKKAAPRARGAPAKATAKAAGKAARGRAPATPPTAANPAQVRRDAEAYKLALADYTACMELLQKKDWQQASRALAAFIGSHRREQELNERARMYLRVCGQHLDADSMKPESLDDRCYLAVVLANEGNYDSALRQLDKALKEHPDSDKVLYLKSSTLALKGDRRRALDALRKAIGKDDRNRIYAANNPDFARLRDDEEFITLTTREDEER
jgi:tetratricopeptide (TPR) repeat protein